VIAGLLLASVSAFVAPSHCSDTGCVSLAVEVRAQGERTPLPEATIIVIPAPPGAAVGRLDPPPPLPEEGPAWMLRGTTSEQGTCTIADVPDGPVRLVVIAPGHARLEAVVRPGPKPSKLFVEPLDEDAYRTVVRTEVGPHRARGQAQLLTREEIRTVPGAQGDPLRAVQNMPGVARSPFNLGLLVLRGASPNTSRVFMGGHAMPRAFHVLSLSSVFPAEVLDDLRLVPGNFDAAYGNATGGIVEIEPRAGRRDGLHGFTELDIGAATTLLEGPVGKGSFIASAQRGYYDLALRTADAVTERVTGEPSSNLYPTYWDYQGMLDYPMRRGSWSVRVFGSGDRLRTPPATQDRPGDFDIRSSFHRLDFAVRSRAAGWRFWWTPSVRFETGTFHDKTSTLEQTRRDGVVSARTELSRRFSSHFAWSLGSDLEVDRFTVERAIEDGGRTVNELDAQNKGVVSSIGVYTSAPVDLGPAHFVLGARGSAFTVRDETEFSIDPRLNSRFDVGERWVLHAAVGKYSQLRTDEDSAGVDLANQVNPGLWYPPALNGFDETIGFAPRTRGLKVREALHASVGADWSFAEGYSAQATAFLREQDEGTPLVSQDGIPIPAATRESALGVQAMVRKHLGGKLYGWVTYTLMRARRRVVDTIPGVEQRSVPTNYDQRHNFGIVASYQLPKRWRIGGRFRVSSGFPYTPLIGSVNLVGTRGALIGAYNSERLGTFHQLDLRVDKRWVRDRAIITGYVDVQNVYNRQNPDAVLYRYDYREAASFVGLPIFPAVGVRVDY
jgi:hypothetical protein